MATVTICSDFGAQDNKICHCFHFFPFYLPWSDGTGCHDLSFLNAEFQGSLFTLLFHPHQEALKKKKRGSLALLHFLPLVWCYLQIWGCWLLLLAVLIPACDSSRLAFHMMYSAYKLNKQGNSTQPCYTPFPILNQSVVPHLVLTVASWPIYRFIRRQPRWSGVPVSSRIFHSLLWSTQRLQCSQWSRIRCFSGSPLFSPWSNRCWQFDLCPSPAHGWRSLQARMRGLKKNLK